MSETSREMTLSEWVDRLPPIHAARQELAAKDATIAALREEVKRLKGENAKLTRADDEAMKLCYDLAARLGNAGARATTAERELEEMREACKIALDMLPRDSKLVGEVRKLLLSAITSAVRGEQQAVHAERPGVD